VSDDLHNTDELLRELDKLTIRTSQGSFVKKEDVEKLIKRRKEATSIDKATTPERMNVHEARKAAGDFLKEQGFGQPGPPEPGRSVSAQPSSRT
jgi:hypothetical protein